MKMKLYYFRKDKVEEHDGIMRLKKDEAGHLLVKHFPSTRMFTPPATFYFKYALPGQPTPENHHIPEGAVKADNLLIMKDGYAVLSLGDRRGYRDNHLFAVEWTFTDQNIQNKGVNLDNLRIVRQAGISRVEFWENPEILKIPINSIEEHLSLYKVEIKRYTSESYALR